MATIAKFTITQIDDKDKITNFMHPALPNSSIINDYRKLVDFKVATIGGYPRSKVASALDKCLSQQKIEDSLYWAFQLLSSGIVDLLWEKLVGYASKNINIYNPHLPEWLYQKSLSWYMITSTERYKKNNILNLRNHPTIRNILTEIIVIICSSKPRKLEILPKNSKSDFIITNFNSKLESSDMLLTHNIFKDNDSKEIRIACNEIAFHLFGGNIVKALYWFSWILAWETINIKKYTKFECNVRSGSFFESKNSIPLKGNTNVIWLIWSIIENVKNKKNIFSNNLEIVMRSLWELFMMKYTSGYRNKRIIYIIWCMSYLCNPIDWNIQIISASNQLMLFTALLKNDKIISRIINSSSVKLLNSADSSSVKLLNPADSIIENNYRHQPQNIVNDNNITNINNTKHQISKNAKVKKGALSHESQQKLDQINKIDKYIETTIFT